ncbi:MAG: ABC transporter permease [Peptostreptococcales bacterium]|jgi:putative ABC transport system permease protein
MNNYLDLFTSTVTQGLIYGLIAFGVYITYKILDFPDLTVDGSFPLGAAITAVLLTHHVHPYLTLLIAILVGAIAGFITGVLHVKLHIRDLLAGIITMTALFSINLQIAGSNLVVTRSIHTIFTSGFLSDVPLIYRKLIISLILVLAIKFILDAYFKTKSGLLLRAVGDNSLVVTTLAKDKGTVKIIGLTISNALVALSGAIVCHEQRSFSSTMGTGQMVFALAAVIMGTTLFRRLGFVKGTTAALVGSIVYKAAIQVAINLGLPANLLKLMTSILFVIILVYGNFQRKEVKNNA